MRAIFLIAILAIAFCAENETETEAKDKSSANGYEKEDNVVILTDDNFDEAISKNDHVLVKFFAPWCGHCKKLAPEYSSAAVTLEKEGVMLAQVDATVQKKLSERFSIQGFPTLKFFIKGKPIEFNGGRTANEIVSWIKKKTGPAFLELDSVEKVEKFSKDAEVAIIYFGEDAEQIKEFESAARQDEDHMFASCKDENAYTKYNVKAGTIVLFKKFDEGRNDLVDKLTESSILAFIKSHSSPLVMKFDDKCAQLIFGKNQPGLFMYRDKSSEKAADFDKLMAAVAEKVKGQIQVVVTDIKEGLESRLAEYIGIKAEDLPSVRIHDTSVDLKKYNMAGEINEENILKFVKDWKDGKLKASLKSQEIPKEQKGDVMVVVGKNFNDEVINNDKDVLVKFYAPWCGHCKQLAPIYEELAKKLKHNSKLVIAEVDSTENEVEQVAVSGFPTIKFWAGGKKSAPIDFSGERTLEGFEKFLQQHATNPIKLTKDEL